MKQQNDWYTGIDYYHNELDKQIAVERLRVDKPTQSGFHDLVEIYYIFTGKASLEINGSPYRIEEGCFVCLYSHHFFRFLEVYEPVEALVVRFHIGLFMYMSWEKHPGNANARLVYDTCPVVRLQGGEKKRILRLAEELLEEQEEQRFECSNMTAYKTLELHAYHCRYAFEAIGRTEDSGIIGESEAESGNEEKGTSASGVWQVIPRILLAASRQFTLEEAADSCGCSAATLNRRIKEACGYTFHQLSCMGVILNACALLHFPELNMDYISDILRFSSCQAFYRLFSRYMGMTPREYQSRLSGGDPDRMWTDSAGIRFLQYMHLHFYENLTLDTICEVFRVRQYTANHVFQTAFGMGFSELLGQIRVCYACAFLRSTSQSILGISHLCGFDSISTFQRNFALWMGQTPGEYRESFILSKNDNKTL